MTSSGAKETLIICPIVLVMSMSMSAVMLFPFLVAESTTGTSPNCGPSQLVTPSLSPSVICMVWFAVKVFPSSLTVRFFNKMLPMGMASSPAPNMKLSKAKE